MDIIGIIKEITGKTTMVNDSLKSKRTEWNSWYAGKVKKFHRYTIFNGKKRVPMERMTLGMPKKLCEDWANLLLNEKTNIVLGDEKSQKTFDKILVDNHFWKKGNGAVEKYMALGIGAIVEGVTDLVFNENGDILTNGTPSIQLINGLKVYPISIKNDKVIECAFVNENLGNTIISVHVLNQLGEYEVHTVECTNASKTSTGYTYRQEDHTIFFTRSKTPWFQILKPNIENNIDINNPLGISIFANAIDILRSVDLTYDSMYNELNLGRKRIFISTRAITVDKVTGEANSVFDQNDVEYYTLPESDENKPIIVNDSQQLRIDAIDQALQRQINLLCSKCGFGINYIKLRPGGETTATQVISENSEMYRNLKKHEIILEEALIDMTKAIIEIVNTYTTEYIEPDFDKIKVQFDDSIIEDKETEKTSDRQDLTNGVISKAEYRAKWYAEDLKLAERRIKEIAIENNDKIITDLTAMSPMISKETYLELNPYIDDAKQELSKIDKEAEDTIKLLNDNELNMINGGEDGRQDTQPNTENTNTVGKDTTN